MKSDELFDILGEIDDKFFEEARLPDEEHGDEVVLERHPFRGFMSIFLPIAACIAIAVAVAFGAKMINGRNDVVPPNTSGSTALAGYPRIALDSVPDISDAAALQYSALLTSITVGEYDVCLLGDDIHTDQNDDMERLHVARLYIASSKDGELINKEEIRLDSASPEYSDYELSPNWLDSYLEHLEMDGGDLIIFKDCGSFRYMLCLSTESIFFTIGNGGIRKLAGDRSALSENDGTMRYCEELHFDYQFDRQANTIRSGGLLYTFYPEKFGLNQYAYAVNIVAHPEMYTPLAEAFEYVHSYEDKELLTGVLIGSADCGEHTVYMVSDEMYVVNGKPDYVYAERVRLLLEKDGLIKSMETIDTSGYEFPRALLTEHSLGAYTMDGRTVIVAALRYHAENSTPDDTLYDAFFYTLESGDTGKLKPVYRLGSVSNTEQLWNSFTVDGDKQILKSGDRTIRFEDGSGKLYFYTDDMLDEVDLSEYPEFDMINIPNIKGCFEDGFTQFGLCKPKVKLAEKQVGVYTFTLIADHVAKDIELENSFIYARTLSTVITALDGRFVARIYRGSGSVWIDGDFASGFPNIYELRDGIIAELWMHEPDGNRFAALRNSSLVELRGIFAGGQYRKPIGETTVDAENNTLLVGGVREYDFYFDKIGTKEPQYTCFYIAASSTGAPGIVAENTAADFTVSLLEGDGGKLLIKVEWNGDKQIIDADNTEPIIKEKAGDYIVPFVLEDGAGFAVYYSLDPESNVYLYASLYAVTDEGVVKLRNKYDFAPAPASGSPSYVGQHLHADGGNYISFDKGYITVDFASGTYEVKYIDDILFSNYTDYDSSIPSQGYVKLAEKYTDRYRIALVCDSAENMVYAGSAAVHCLETKLVIADADGDCIDFFEFGERYFGIDALSEYFELFELRSGTAMAFYQTIETWSNSLPSAIIFVIEGSGGVLQPVDFVEDISQGLTVDGNAIVSGDTRIELDKYFR
ncbi:MAG: hypothetical protein K2N38_12750 [Oscillospiraceae bacterium]|nr:hypothetical protein [Oscillospiraceae bacterium]